VTSRCVNEQASHGNATQTDDRYRAILQAQCGDRPRLHQPPIRHGEAWGRSKRCSTPRRSTASSRRHSPAQREGSGRSAMSRLSARHPVIARISARAYLAILRWCMDHDVERGASSEYIYQANFAARTATSATTACTPAWCSRPRCARSPRAGRRAGHTTRPGYPADRDIRQ
jgi:hypothetical protein